MIGPFLFLSIDKTLFKYYCFISCRTEKVVWGTCTKGLSEKVQKLLNRAARILMSANFKSNLKDLSRVLGCL